MEIEEFAEKVCHAVRKELGKGYRVELKKVRKNNGVLLHGIFPFLSRGKGADLLPLDWYKGERRTACGCTLY